MLLVKQARDEALRAPWGHETSPPYSARFQDWENALKAAGLPAALTEWQHLARESDAALFWESALHFTRRLSALHRPDLALLLLQHLSYEAPELFATQAKRQLSELSGRGNFGSKAEFLMNNFAEQALDPSALVAMTAAGCTYRLVRLGVLSRLGPGLGPRLWAAAAGFTAEVPAFTLSARAMHGALGSLPQGSPPLREELAASALFLGSIKLAGFGGISLAKHIPARGAFNAPLRFGLPTASLLAGIGIGHRLEIAAGLRPQRNGEEALAEDLGTLLQLHAAGSISRLLLGRNWARFEQELELRAQQIHRPPASPMGPRPAWAEISQGSPSRDLEPPRFADLGRTLMVGKESTPPPALTKDLTNRYLARFPPDSQGYYSTAILETVQRIACSLPHFHERLIEALYYSPNRGSKDQLYAVLAIENVFNSDAMRTATGSFDYSILQLLLGQTATEDHRATRLQSFQKIFLALEKGLNRQAMQDLILSLPYDETWAPPAEPRYNAHFWRQHREEVVHHWSDYRPQDADLLLNFVHQQSLGNTDLASRMIRTFGEGRRQGYYLAVDIDATLDYARAHPLGNLVLQRFHDILATRDVPAKLSEMAGDPGSLDTVDRIESLRKHGVSPEKIAYQLNGTEHTGYLNDLRLARKVVAVFEEVGTYLKNPRLREEGQRQVMEAFWEYARSGRGLQVRDLIDMMRLHPSPGIEAFVAAWEGGGPEARVDIRILPQERFQKLADHGEKLQGDTYALTIPRHPISAKNLELFPELTGGDTKDLIFIPKLPRFDLSTTEGADHAFHELINRVKSLVHEAEHWRHANGVYFGAESASQPVRLAGVSRQERLVSEIMAYLEEFRWRVRFRDVDFFELSSRLGLTVPTFLRNNADFTYFGQANQDKSIH